MLPLDALAGESPWGVKIFSANRESLLRNEPFRARVRPRVLATSLAALIIAGCLRDDPAGTPLPDFTLTTLDGETLTPATLRGNVVVIDAMATYCPPCRASMPAFREFVSERADRPLTFLTLDVDETDRKGDLLREFRDEYNATWHFAYDTADLREKLRVLGLPTIYVADADGVIRHRIEYRAGAIGEDRLADAVDSLLAEAEARG